MKIVIAPDKFKGSLTGIEFCNAVQEGLKKILPQTHLVLRPLADGGDGTVDVVNRYIEGEKIKLQATDPLFRNIETYYSYSQISRIAFIEMAEISGLVLLKETERNCRYTTSLGFGELIEDAIKKGAREIILGIGGSATNDGGMGMAHALGFRFLNKDGKELKPIGENLIEVNKIDTTRVHPKLGMISFKVACDVLNPFYGKNGAAHIYAAQKGASKEEIQLLDKGLENFAQVIQEQFGINVQEIVGAGTAGGMGAGTLVFLNAKLISGIELIKEIADFDKTIEGADLIITGEGKLDQQTLSGKTISGVLQSAKKQNIPVAAFCGAVEISEEKYSELGFSHVAAISEECTNFEEAKKNAYANLVKAITQYASSLSSTN